MTTTIDSEFTVGAPIREADRTNRAHVIELLNATLADTIDLKTQAKHAHWNVKGRDFLPLHQFFDQIAEHLEAASDVIAERITALGGTAKGTARLVVERSSLEEYDLAATDGREHVRALSHRMTKLVHAYEMGIARCAESADAVTVDLFTGIARQAEKDLWFLEACSR